MSKKDELRALTKADPFLESLQKLGGYVRSHQTLVVASVAVLLLAGAGIAFAFNQQDKQAGAASKLLAEAQKTYDKMPLGDDAAPPPSATESTEEKYATKEEWRTAVKAKLEAIDKEFPGSGAARVGKLYRAGLELDAKNPAEAEKLYRAFIAETKSTDPMASAASLSLAAALEDQGKVDDAIKVLSDMAPKLPAPPAPKEGEKADAKDAPKAPPMHEEALMALAKLQERAGKPKDARATYERIKTELPASAARYKADQRLNALPKE